MKLPFDQAAKYYDQTRAEPEWVMSAMANTFLQATRATADSKILEVGIGTGRIATHLLARDLKIVGVDLSLAMMRELQKKTHWRAARVSLAQTDAETLPFPDETFDVVYAVHVYHLVPDWRAALAETRRVLKRGGRFLLSHHYRTADSINRRVREKFGELAQARGYNTKRPGATDIELRSELEKWNGHVETIEACQWKYSTSPAQILDEIDARIYSDVWLVPAEVHAELTPHLRGWAKEEFGDLTREVETDAEFNWLVVRKT